MSEGNGKSKEKIFKMSIPGSMTQEEMIFDIWVNMQMLTLKVYGDKEKKITGITDEIEAIRGEIKYNAEQIEERVDAIRKDIQPLLLDRKIIKVVVSGLKWVLGVLGLSKLAQSWFEKYY